MGEDVTLWHVGDGCDDPVMRTPYEQVRGRFHLRPGLVTERPQLVRRTVELVDRGVDLERVLLAGTDPVNRPVDMRYRHTELRLVVHSRRTTGSWPSSLGRHPNYATENGFDQHCHQLGR
ncbi:hypothetical protein ACWIGW_41535 [Nocardia brasiliensis]